MDELIDFSEQEFRNVLQKQINEFVNIKSNPFPHAYLVVGQPGAGKTTIASMLQKQYADDIVFINGDEYRK